MLYYDSIIDGNRYKSKAKYKKSDRDTAMKKINDKKQELIKELTIHYM